MRRLIGLAACALAALTFAPAAQAVPLTFGAFLDGPSENPPNAVPGTGEVIIVYDDLAHTLDIDAEFSGLIGTTTMAHIHCCIAPPGNVGVAVGPGTLPGFPLNVTSGTYDALIDLTDPASYTAAFLSANGGTAGAEAAIVAAMSNSTAYFNIHTTFDGAGEIRGFLALVVPEPATMAVFGLGLFGVAYARRRLRH